MKSGSIFHEIGKYFHEKNEIQQLNYL